MNILIFQKTQEPRQASNDKVKKQAKIIHFQRLFDVQIYLISFSMRFSFRFLCLVFGQAFTTPGKVPRLNKNFV